MKIVVLAGGISTEREISIVSGTQVCKALRSRGHQAILVDVYFGREDADPMQAFTDEYDVDAAAAYARSFDGQVEKSIQEGKAFFLSLIHISEPTRRTPISYAVFCLKKKKNIACRLLLEKKNKQQH